MFEAQGIVSRLKENRLSPAEIKVALLLLKGYTNAEIASSLFVTEKTIKFHITSIYKRVKIYYRAKFIVWCLCPKLLAPHDTTFDQYLK